MCIRDSRYDPGVGPFPNICALAEIEPMQVLDRLRRESRPTLKPDYLIRRHSTERWLAEAAAKALGRNFEQRPAYFFLGDFSHLMDLSRPAALVVPLSTLPPDSISFTLGDSMSVAEQPGRRVYTCLLYTSPCLLSRSFGTTPCATRSRISQARPRAKS